MPLSDNVVLAPKVALFFDSVAGGYKNGLITKINEVAESSDSGEGVLVYKTLFFREYKVGQQLRFFGHHYDGRFFVFLLGNHKNKKYEGIVYDGKDEFPVTFDNKVRSEIEWAKMALLAITTTWGLNTMSSPVPIYD